MKVLAHFEKDDGRKLPVSDDFLLPFLSPTSPGTNYWDSPPPGPMLDRQRGRVVLQLHQVLALLAACGVDLAGKRLLDIVCLDLVNLIAAFWKLRRPEQGALTDQQGWEHRGVATANQFVGQKSVDRHLQDGDIAQDICEART